jgi:hypothetical protein
MLSIGQIKIKIIFKFVSGSGLSVEEFDPKYKFCGIYFIKISQ